MKNAIILPTAFIGGLFWGCAARGPAGGAEGIAERLDEIARRLDAIEARDLGGLSRRLEALEKKPAPPAPAQSDLSRRVKDIEKIVGRPFGVQWGDLSERVKWLEERR